MRGLGDAMAIFWGILIILIGLYVLIEKTLFVRIARFWMKHTRKGQQRINDRREMIEYLIEHRGEDWQAHGWAGNHVRELRERKLMTLTEFARKARIDARTIHSVERGSDCPVYTKQRILSALGLCLT